MSIFKHNIDIIVIYDININVSYAKMKTMTLYIAYENFVNYFDMNSKSIHSLKFITDIFIELFLNDFLDSFDKSYESVTQRLSFYVNNIKYKQSVVIDIENNDIVLDTGEVNKNSDGKVIKSFFDITSNAKIYNEICFHCKNLFDDYVDDNNFNYDAIAISKYYAIIECKATYPRLIIVIKFLPVLRGFALVHIYTQKKLSRGVPSSASDSYKEFDVAYGPEGIGHADLKIDSSKIKKIENFIYDYLTLNDMNNRYITKWKIFHVNDKKSTMKYFNEEKINNVIAVSEGKKDSDEVVRAASPPEMTSLSNKGYNVSELIIEESKEKIFSVDMTEIEKRNDGMSSVFTCQLEEDENKEEEIILDEEEERNESNWQVKNVENDKDHVSCI